MRRGDVIESGEEARNGAGEDIVRASFLSFAIASNPDYRCNIWASDMAVIIVVITRLCTREARLLVVPCIRVIHGKFRSRLLFWERHQICEACVLC